MKINLGTSLKIEDMRLADRLFISGEIDTENLYAAGDGLVLSGNEFSVNSDIIVKRQSDTCRAQGVNSRAVGENSIAYTDNSIAEGEECVAGTNSFRVISGDINEMTWTLKSVKGLKPGMLYTVRLFANYDAAGTILSVIRGQNKISVDGMPANVRVSENLSDEYLKDHLSANWEYLSCGYGLRAHPTSTRTEVGPGGLYGPEYVFKDFDDDYNTIWIIGHPELGDLSGYATGAFAHGYGNIAQRQYSHAEGACTAAGGKYTHSEGLYTIAAAYSSHAEGNHTSAFGQNSHAEGTSTEARGMNSHAEGIYSKALGYGSHADGLYAVADGANTYVWNGTYQTYRDHGEGTFNVRPKEGLDGFYVADKPMSRHIADIAEVGVNQLRCENIRLKRILNKIVSRLSSDYEYSDIGCELVSADAYCAWHASNRTILSYEGYGVFKAYVMPGDQISVSNANCNWYAGFAGFNAAGQKTCAWDMSEYVYDSESKSTFIFKTDAPALSGMTRAELDAKTVEDRFHWLRKRVANAVYLPNGGNNVEFTVPEDCAYILFSKGQMRFSEDGTPAESTLPKIFVKEIAIADFRRVSEELEEIAH